MWNVYRAVINSGLRTNFAGLNIQQALLGTVLVPRQKKKYAELDEKIFNAVGYDGRVDTEMYRRTLGHLNHKRQ